MPRHNDSVTKYILRPWNKWSPRNCNYASLIFLWPFWFDKLEICFILQKQMYWTHGYVCTVSRHQSNYKENYIFISIANCLVNLLNISLSNHFVLHFSSLKKVKQALFNISTACSSYNMGNKNHSSLLSYKNLIFVLDLADLCFIFTIFKTINLSESRICWVLFPCWSLWSLLF